MNTRAGVPPIICLAGPTAAGKSAAVLALASRWPVEIINVDSATIYRDMDIGTAKPTAAEQALTPQHLLDIRDPSQSYSAAEFVNDAHALITQIRARGRIPVLAGGTMLYFKALRDGLDDLPGADPVLRAELLARAEALGWPALHAELALLDPVTAQRLAPADSQRIQRALEICILSKQPMSALLSRHRKGNTKDATQDSDTSCGPATGGPSARSDPSRGVATGVGAPRDAQATPAADSTGDGRGASPASGARYHPDIASSTDTAARTETTRSANNLDQAFGAGYGDDPSHVAQTWLTVSLEPSDRLALHDRIGQRFDAMMKQGLLEEVARLRARGDLSVDLPAIRCVGYRQLWNHLADHVDLDTAIEQAKAATRQLAKRQLTWLRSQPERHVIDCLSGQASAQVVDFCAPIVQASMRVSSQA